MSESPEKLRTKDNFSEIVETCEKQIPAIKERALKKLKEISMFNEEFSKGRNVIGWDETELKSIQDLTSSDIEILRDFEDIICLKMTIASERDKNGKPGPREESFHVSRFLDETDLKILKCYFRSEDVKCIRNEVDALLVQKDVHERLREKEIRTIEN